MILTPPFWHYFGTI